MVAVVMRHTIQSAMERTDNRTVHSNRSFLLKIEDDIITVSVKKADLDSWLCLSEILWAVIQ